jgi:uncharacterized protein
MTYPLEIPWTNSGRPFDYPSTPWTGYQEWHNVIFLHWKIESGIIRGILPQELEIDTFDGMAWISVVPLSVLNLHPRLLPSFKTFSNFEEINLRTYVIYKGMPGIYFFSLESSRILPVFAARLSTGLPYVKSEIWREEGMFSGNSEQYGFQFYLNYKLDNTTIKKDALSTWLSDRFRLYVKTSGYISKIDVHHHPWILKPLNIRYIKLNYMIGGWPLSNRPPDIAHFSEGVKVVTWRKTKD